MLIERLQIWLKIISESNSISSPPPPPPPPLSLRINKEIERENFVMMKGKVYVFRSSRKYFKKRMEELLLILA